MTQGKHTAGPWRILPLGNVIVSETGHAIASVNSHNEDGAKKFKVLSFDAYGKPITEIVEIDVESAANAALIKAAPEMLAELEWALTTISSPLLLRRFEKIIKKARGGI